jgi:hypothetical protein
VLCEVLNAALENVQQLGKQFYAPRKRQFDAQW